MDNIINTKDIIFETRNEAEEILEKMKEISDAYASVTFADFNDLVGLNTSYEDTRYYWTSPMLSHSDILRVRDGWIINLCAPIHRNESGKVTYRSYAPKERKNEVKPVNIFIHASEIDIDDVDEILSTTLTRIKSIPDREFHITIV